MDFEALIKGLEQIEQLSKPIPPKEIERKRKEIFRDEWIREQQAKSEQMIREIFAGITPV